MAEKQPNPRIEDKHPDETFQDHSNKKDIFDKEIEQILTNFNEKTTDLTKLQAQIISLFKKHPQSESISKNGKEIEIDEKLISEASTHLIEQHANIIKNNTANLANNGSDYELMIKKSKEDFKRVVKNFAIYEIYKFMNLKRIAGETKQDNFAHNVIIKGLESAKHYTGGGKPQDIKKYSGKLIDSLQKHHLSFEQKNYISSKQKKSKQER